MLKNTFFQPQAPSMGNNCNILLLGQIWQQLQASSSLTPVPSIIFLTACPRTSPPLVIGFLTLWQPAHKLVPASHWSLEISLSHSAPQLLPKLG